MNPITGREYKYQKIHRAEIQKKVMIVGGGPAGMMAAQTLRKRGHEVVLCEKKHCLGGLLPDISSLPFKNDMRRYLEWNIRQTEKCGVRIVLDTEVVPEIVERENPDALFLAIGGAPLLPEIDGIHNENVKTVLDVDSKRALTGEKVVVCGGGISGLECALGLAMEGKEVSVVDMVPTEKFGADTLVIAVSFLT